MSKPDFEKIARSSVATLRKHDHDDFWLGFIQGIASDCYDIGQQSQWRTDMESGEIHTDVEELVKNLDHLASVADKIGVKLRHIEEAASMLQHLSQWVIALEKQNANNTTKGTR